MRRIRIVARFGGTPSPLRPYMTLSLVLHLAAIVAVYVVPEFRKRPMIEPDSVFSIELAPAFAPKTQPQAPVARPPAAKPPPPEPAPPPEGARAVEQVPKVDPKPRKKPPKPPPERPPEPVRPPAPDESAALDQEGEGGLPSDGRLEEAAGNEDASVIAGLAGDDPEFAWYRASVSAALYGRWRPPILARAGGVAEVSVSFEVRRDGTVANLRVDASSGIRALDRSALRAVSEASPLPALPAHLRQSVLPARFIFRLHPEDN
ncbi:MAG: TonB family protein [bacterium]|nr:TonB family protein [bacterium]